MKLLIVLFSILFIGCSTTSVDINKMNFSLEDKPQKVKPLKYYKQSNINNEKAEKIMQNILANGEYMGYYYINHDYERTEETLFLFKISLIDGTIGFALNVLGVPKARKYYNLKARVYLFDSHGDITGIYEKSGTITKYVGLYYGHSVPLEEIEKEYNAMFKEILDNIDSDKERVNYLLELSGTLKDDKTAEVFTNVYKLVSW
jgi:hypothetical protein